MLPVPPEISPVSTPAESFDEALSFVNFLYKENVDAILVQDIGLVHILRNIFPDLTLHASTQMNVHSVEEARRLKELGFKEITETKVVETKEPVAPVKSTTKTRTKAK